MSNVLDDEKQQQIRALGRLGWTLSRIQEATGIRRETISGYLKAAGIAVRSRGRPSESQAKPAISRAVVSTDSGQSNPAISEQVSTDPGPETPAWTDAVSTDGVAIARPGRAPSASACEPYRELITEALRRGRNAMAIWQDLVDDHGFTARYASVRRFVRLHQLGRRGVPDGHRTLTSPTARSLSCRLSWRRAASPTSRRSGLGTTDAAEPVVPGERVAKTVGRVSTHCRTGRLPNTLSVRSAVRSTMRLSAGNSFLRSRGGTP
jgi:hypothetical protein